ncbi:ABC transporter substrate-binding protein [Glycomyces harbinensis]|uniref:Sulfonate transport system substrate-binding protein n=1 Tax=Glycomyces harbinensis TaxID=58114 RepID=A0A1G6RU29_9ACTN|nr:ABC transporter substrate-binding protein [Glycomyces harbinensis]SDD08132.1 sulfonate transport system substrate-binding protein [Glycomyces harbinensis]
MSSNATRRTLLAGAPAVAALALAACSEEPSGPVLAADADLPTAVPEGTRLVIGDPAQQLAFELSGLLGQLTFDYEWANISGGPKSAEAFRAKSLDISSVADIPPIHATWTNLPVKIVAAAGRIDPLEHPIYDLGVAPGVDVASLEDLAGKKIAYSPGQAQGALILRVLDAAGLSQDDVELVELPSTADTYSNALAGGEVDVAPIGGTQVKSYLNKYASDGATAIPHGLRDDPWTLYAPIEVLEDADKAAAIAQYVRLWGAAKLWTRANREEWINAWYVDHEGLPYEDGEYLFDREGEPDFPETWDETIERHQETIEVVAEGTGNEVFDAEEIYDRRFEPLVAEGIAEYGEAGAS